jgi:NAD-dependent SIR2 family protein deacetylase
LDAAASPGGDADLEHLNFSGFAVPPCRSCGGILKPDVVFFAENVPRDQVAAAQASIEQADAMLIVGSSLTGFRFAQMAARRGIPIAAVNLGRTRADDLLAARPLCIPASNRSAQSLLSQASRLDGQCQNRVQPVPIFNA